MHSFIFQIENSPVSEDERISESDFYEHLDDIPADSVREVTEDREEEAIAALSGFLPESMFKCEGREITFLGGDEEFFKGWTSRVKDALTAESPEKIAKGNHRWSYLYRLLEAVENALGVYDRFYSNEDGFCKKSTEFILDMTHAEPGTKFYVGAVIDYHH